MSAPNSQAESTTIALEAVCGQLRALQLEFALPSDLGARIDALLADPTSHELLLRRLVSVGRELFAKVAREVLDNEADSMESTDSSVSHSNDEQSEDCDEVEDMDSDDMDVKEHAVSATDQPGSTMTGHAASASASESSDDETPRESETDIDDVLTDKDMIEEILHEYINTHEQRQDERKKIRATGKLPFYLMQEENDWLQQEDFDDGQHDAQDIADELEDERETRREQLEEQLDELLSELEQNAAGKASQLDGAQDTDEASDEQRAKRLRSKVDELPDEALLQTLREAEERTDLKTEEADKMDAAILSLTNATTTFCEVAGLDPSLACLSATESVTELKDLWVAPLVEADRVLKAARAGALGTYLEVIKATNAVKRELSELIHKQPHLKRKWDELEALDEIKAEQQHTECVFDRRAFKGLVSELGFEYKTDLRFDDDAIDALQAAAESYLVSLFSDANLAAIHAKRTLVQSSDIRFAASCMCPPVPTASFPGSRVSFKPPIKPPKPVLVQPRPTLATPSGRLHVSFDGL